MNILEQISKREDVLVQRAGVIINNYIQQIVALNNVNAFLSKENMQLRAENEKLRIQLAKLNT